MCYKIQNELQNCGLKSFSGQKHVNAPVFLYARCCTAHIHYHYYIPLACVHKGYWEPVSDFKYTLTHLQKSYQFQHFE